MWVLLKNFAGTVGSRGGQKKHRRRSAGVAIASVSASYRSLGRQSQSEKIMSSRSVMLRLSLIGSILLSFSTAQYMQQHHDLRQA